MYTSVLTMFFCIMIHAQSTDVLYSRLHMVHVADTLFAIYLLVNCKKALHNTFSYIII